MSINLTQEFKFESDSIESVQTMLEAIVPVLFPKVHSEYVRLNLTQKVSYFHNDGSKYIHGPNVIELPDGRFGVLADKGRVIGGTVVNKIEEIFHTVNKAATVSCEKKYKTPPTRMFVARLSDYVSDVKEESVVFNSHKEMINKSIEILKNADLSKFQEFCGTGYDFAFNQSDGDIEPGYRLQYEPNGGWNQLFLYICHIYYGK